jgi:hypothetical protein
MRPELVTNQSAADGIARLLGDARRSAEWRPGSVGPAAVEGDSVRTPPTKASSMIVLGLDPGPKFTGWVEFDGECVRRWGIDKNDDIPFVLHQNRAHWSVLAVEDMTASQRPFGNEIRDTLLWIHGRRGICDVWNDDSTLYCVSRTAVKMHLCGRLTGHGDSEVWKALVARFGRHTKKQPNPVTCVSGHARAALAVAVTVWDRLVDERRAES